MTGRIKRPVCFMELTLYRTEDAPNKLIKSFVDSQPAKTAKGALRERTSLIDPVLWVTADPRGFNYARIDQFSRYYFIDEVQSVNNGIWEIRLHVDVLMTYADEIKKLQATRVQSSSPDPYSASADYPVSVKSDIRRVNFPYTFKESAKMILVAVVGA